MIFSLATIQPTPLSRPSVATQTFKKPPLNVWLVVVLLCDHVDALALDQGFLKSHSVWFLFKYSLRLMSEERSCLCLGVKVCPGDRKMVPQR